MKQNTSTLKTFFDNFEQLAEAPNGIAKLRELILQLAVQGKLVPQNPKDEPIDTILDEMSEKRDKLITAKKIKEPRKVPEVDKCDLPFKSPNSWRWQRWGHIADWITYGFTRPMSHVDEGPAIVTAKNVQDGYMLFDNTHKADDNEYSKLSPKDRPRYGDLLITKDGTIGRAALVETREGFCINQSVAIIWLESCLLFRPYLLLVIRSPYTQNIIWELAEGAALKHLSITDFEKLLIPLPPLAEQKRIVAKVGELMALCDELEEKKRNKQQVTIDLNKAATHHLLTAKKPTDFTRHWQRICDHFDLFYNCPENVSQLRQTILQLAVQGKLVPQNPKDEPASVLLEKIQAEKEKLIAEGKIKKSKSLSSLKPDEIPFD
ncbi:MAG: restriction endonuclease, partial [Planctomycetes bacterium]|nr:restriction endonuclease [Planctomycetota bacterium]